LLRNEELLLCAGETSRAPLANMASGWLVVKPDLPRRVVLEKNHDVNK